MKVLVVGDFYSEIYAKAFYDGFIKLNIETIKFDWNQYFKDIPHLVGTGEKKELKDLYYLFQSKFSFGPLINKMNKDLLLKVKKENIDFIFIYRGIYIFPKTIKQITQRGIKVFGYNNDDPFSKDYPKYYWRHYMNSLKYYSHIFSYREKNIQDYKSIGIYSTILRSYYIKERNYYMDELPKDNQYECDVLFAGHFEDDGRDKYLKALIDRGYKVKIYGGFWQNSRYYRFFKSTVGEIKHIGKDYNLAINSSKIALVFLSKINKDTYTRRCFEIPATKTFMFTEYTSDLANLFDEGREIDFFRNEIEFLIKIEEYLKDLNKIRDVGEKGYEKLMKVGHEVKDRIQEVIREYDKIKQGENR